VGLAVLADSFLPVAGSKLFLAPECFDLNPRAVTKQGDIYSLGLLFHCFLFRKRCPDALSVMKTFEQVCKWVLAGDRPNFLVEHPTVLVEMIRQCWDTDPQNRPTAVELLSRMRIVILDCAQIIERNKPFWLSDILVPKPVDLVKAVWKDFDETPSLEFFSAVHMEALKHLARMVDCQLESPQEIFRRIDDILLIGRKELFEPNQPPVY
jgi:serine/threonine protein kinase